MSNDPHDLLAAYALDALDDDERERFERHLADCEECSEQLAHASRARRGPGVRGRGAGPAEGAARPDHRGRACRTASGGHQAAAGGTGHSARSRPSQLRLPAWRSASASGRTRCRTRSTASGARTRRTRKRRSSSLREATAKPLVGANGSLLVADNGRAAIVVCGLAGAPNAKTYEAWVISGKSPQPAGLFRGGSGCSPVLLTQRVPKNATVAVTARAGRWSVLADAANPLQGGSDLTCPPLLRARSPSPWWGSAPPGMRSR